MSSSVACIDYRDGKVFIAKRQNVGEMGGKWEFPGGKIDEGENFQDTIQREMMEEFSVKVEVIEKITSTTFMHKNKECFLDAFFIRMKEDGMNRRFVLTEHTDYRWADINEIPSLDFVDSDLKIYPAVLEAVKKLQNK